MSVSEIKNLLNSEISKLQVFNAENFTNRYLDSKSLNRESDFETAVSRLSDKQLNQVENYLNNIVRDEAWMPIIEGFKDIVNDEIVNRLPIPQNLGNPSPEQGEVLLQGSAIPEFSFVDLF